FTLKGREMAEGVESLTFKIWVGGAEGAGIKFRDLVYSVPLADGQVVYDERFTDPGTWQADGILLAKAPAGMKLNVKPGTTFGNILGAQRIDRAMADAIYFETSDVKDCDLTLQLVTFDPDGNYVSSVDLIRKVTNGAHAARLAQAAWPPGAESFGIKIWMGDGATAAAVLKRLLVLGP
ncbi:MAG: hypothetical protein JXB04_10155, partial [Kiritimatiellae bacterium]|nr:hypothetical protein [Kiritimatiellia bacterium]